MRQSNFKRKTLATILGLGLFQISGCPIEDLFNVKKDEPPVAIITPLSSVEGKAPLEVKLSAWDSYAPNNPNCINQEAGTSCLDFNWTLGYSTKFLNDENMPLLYEDLPILSEENGYNIFFTSNEGNFAYKFEKPGNYKIKLAVFDKNTEFVELPEISTSIDVIVNPRGDLYPFAMITPKTPHHGKAPLEVLLSASESFDPDDFDCLNKEQEKNCLDFHWEITYWDVEKQQIGESILTAKGENFAYKFENQGNYMILLSAIDRDGRLNNSHLTAIINDKVNVPPFAMITPESSLKGKAPLEVKLSSQGSYDPDNANCTNCLNFFWDVLKANTKWEEINENKENIFISEGENFSYRFEKPGEYGVFLYAIDKDGGGDRVGVHVSVR